jgi:ABC-type cobalamin/Fe3+-siderophores transport system ATPase subunit
LRKWESVRCSSTRVSAARLRLPAGTGSVDIAAEVDHTLARLGLGDRADVKVGSLSGGQRKRASIAVELLADPHLFFLDEPTSGLDPATGAGVMRQLRRLARGGTTIVVTTHAPADLTLCDRIVFLAGGGLVSMAAVSLGLLASAAVHNPAQATLALPMLCFPQVLFAGAVVAIGEMNSGGRVMSLPLAGRWGFESLGRTLDVDQLIGSEPAAAGYVESFAGSPTEGWVVLTTIALAAVAGTVVVLRRRTTA